MSDGCQANTSTYARRKATSAPSYLGSRVALMVKVPPVPSSLAGTFLVAGGAAVVSSCLLAGPSGAASTAAQCSGEARLPEWAPEHSPGLAFLPAGLDGTSSTAAQHPEEERLPEWAPEHLPDLVFMPAGLDGTSSTAAQHSEEARLPEWAPEHLPGLAFMPAGLDGTSSTAAQHSEEACLPEWAPEHLPDFFFPPEAPAASGPRATAAVASRYIWSAQIRASFLSPGTEMTLIGPGILSMLYA